ncbi:MAG: hypothetical protein ACPGU5_05045 [Lishizhenia sp.]
MKVVYTLFTILLFTSQAISQEVFLEKDNFSRKEIRSFNSFTKLQQEIALKIVNSELVWIENTAKKEISFSGTFSLDEFNNANNYSDLGVLPALNSVTYYLIDNSTKIVVVPSVRRTQIENISKENLK